MKVRIMPANSTSRTGRLLGSCTFVTQTNADHAHHTRASTSSPRPSPPHERSWYSSSVTCVTANTNTRSHSSSTGVVRRSAAAGSMVVVTRYGSMRCESPNSWPAKPLAAASA